MTKDLNSKYVKSSYKSKRKGRQSKIKRGKYKNRHSTKEDAYINNTYKNRGSISPVIKKLKTIMRYYYTPNKLTKF